MKTKLWIEIVVFFFLAFSICLAQEAPLQVMKVANEKMFDFLNRIPINALEQYGFTKDISFDRVYLDNPFKLYTILPSQLSSDQTVIPSSLPVKNLISPTNLWCFPVMIDSSMRAILIVDKLNNEWEAVSLGYASLAHELNIIKDNWPKTKGYNPILIKSFQAREYFFSVPEVDEFNLTSIRSTNSQPSQLERTSSERVDYSKLNKTSIIVERLRPIVEQNLNTHQR